MQQVEGKAVQMLDT